MTKKEKNEIMKKINVKTRWIKNDLDEVAYMLIRKENIENDALVLEARNGIEDLYEKIEKIIDSLLSKIYPRINPLMSI